MNMTVGVVVLIQTHLDPFKRLFVCFVALRPKSTAMVMEGWSVHLTTYRLNKWLNMLSLVTDNNPS